MKIYEHRINKISQLRDISPDRGVEVDIRTYHGNIVLAHDPFEQGELFTEWLESWNGQSLIINVKEEGLESYILDLLSNYNVEDFFFLDQSYPSIRRLINLGISKLATRVSDFEDIDTALKSGSDWVWLDSFTGQWDYLPQIIRQLYKTGQKTCLVSPELQRSGAQAELKKLNELISSQNLDITAVCTKYPESWIK
jgi:hypothetical protein